MKTMKKWTALLLAALLTCSFAGCGNSSAGGDASGAASSDNAEGTQLQFTLGTALTKEEEYTAEDGTVLVRESYNLPQLALCTADGEIVEADDSAQADICRTFNAEMQSTAEDLDASAAELLETAQEAYAALTEEEREFWTEYAEGLSADTTYLTDTLVSVLGSGYLSSGGAHPNAYSRTWNIDLTTGDFLTFDTLTGGDSSQAEALNTTLTTAIFDQINAQNLAEGYFADYQDQVNHLSTTASFYFQDSGMVIEFDPYVLAPYAAGTQTFLIPYDTFYSSLSESMQALLSLSQDAPAGSN